MNKCTKQLDKIKDSEIEYKMTFSVAIYNLVLKSYLLVTSDFNYNTEGGFKNSIHFDSWNNSSTGTEDKDWVTMWHRFAFWT
jgi:hypothetical protein